MKNIHVLETDKPSRLYKSEGTKELELLSSYGVSIDGNGKNIYITNDEEIKKGDWVKNITIDLEIPFKLDKDGILYTQLAPCQFHKIILTTDPDLIKDGVQEIDDDFLEWFVNNPTCEFVEVNKVEEIPAGISYGMFGNDEPPTELVYKIIIPKEEPKQKTFEENFIDCIGKSKVIYEPKKETLEEAAHNYAEQKQFNRTSHLIGFRAGAKWQEQRMYSEEDFKELVYNMVGALAYANNMTFNGAILDDLFEKFKKK